MPRGAVRKGETPMKKKILLAVDDSIHSADAIKYAVRMSLPVKDVSYTLFHVQPTISQYLLDKAFFLGSVAKHVLDKISGRALWLVS